jgi:multiple sugar transport system ATP-binding protein
VSTIRIRDLRVTRGDAVVLTDVDLDVASGERLALLGASGAGKTTLLRAIAGLEPAAAGSVWFDDRDVTDLTPGERGLAMVTQESSLQPHRDVWGNLAFPLEIHRVPADEQRRRIEAEARAFSLRDLLGRRPRALSAGKRHEVALARTLVRRVDVLLVDEPFAHLDPPRRIELQRELLEVQEGYGLTLVLASNDQRVAITCGQRVAVLDRGRIVQVGPPMELFHEPATTFVAGAVGELPMTLYPGMARRVGGGTRIEAGPITVRSAAPALRAPAVHRIEVGIRPTSWHPPGRPSRRAGVTVGGRVRRREFLGARVSLTVAAGEVPVHAVVPSPGPQVDDEVDLWCPASEIHVFDAVTGSALAHGV